MTDFFQTPRFQLPDEWEVTETMCVRVTIPADAQYFGQLIGLLDTLKWSKNFAPDPTRTGAATVSRTWQAALESEPIEAEGCDMPEFRINPETCLLEVNCSDDPENPDWQTVITPATDPRTDVKYPPPYPEPPPEGQTNECLAAANISAWVWIACGGWAGQLQYGTFAEFVVLVMGVIGGLFTLLTDIIIDNTTTLFTSIDPDTIEADFAALDQQDFIDIIVCYLNSDGTMPAANWGDFLDELLSHAGENQAWNLVHYCMLLVGYGGVNLLGRIGGITEAECAECTDCTPTETFYDFQIPDAYDFEASDGGAGWTPAFLDGTNGWKSTNSAGAHRGLISGVDGGALQVTKIEAVVEATNPSGTLAVVFYDGYPTNQLYVTPVELAAGVHTVTWIPDDPVDIAGLEVYWRDSAGYVGYLRSITIDHCEVE